MELANLLVGHLGEALKHVREVVAHVGVRAEPDVDVGICAAACRTVRTTFEDVQVIVGTIAWALALVTRLVLM